MAGQPDTPGPSWWDVEELLMEVEGHYATNVEITLVCTSRAKTRQAVWKVVVAAHRWKQREGQKTYKSVCGFRGQAGYRQVTAAIHHSLREVAWQLKTAADAASEQSFF